MKSIAQLAHLKEILFGMERDLGLDDLGRIEKNILYAAAILAETADKFESEQIRQHTLLSGVSRSSYFRALKEVVDAGYPLAGLPDLTGWVDPVEVSETASVPSTSLARQSGLVLALVNFDNFSAKGHNFACEFPTNDLVFSVEIVVDPHGAAIATDEPPIDLARSRSHQVIAQSTGRDDDTIPQRKAVTPIGDPSDQVTIPGYARKNRCQVFIHGRKKQQFIGSRVNKVPC